MYIDSSKCVFDGWVYIHIHNRKREKERKRETEVEKEKKWERMWWKEEWWILYEGGVRISNMWDAIITFDRYQWNRKRWLCGSKPSTGANTT